jgi:hypothetical protein
MGRNDDVNVEDQELKAATGNSSSDNDDDENVIDEFLLGEEDFLGDNDGSNNNDISELDEQENPENQQEDSLDPEVSKEIAGYDPERDDILQDKDQQEDSLDPEISKEIAGYDPEMDDTLQQEDMLQMDEEESSDRSFSEKGIVRAIFVLGATGVIVLIGFLFWNLMFGDSSPSETAGEETEEETVPFEQDETGRLKAQMAFNDQRRSVRDAQAQEENEQPEPPEPSPSPSPQAQQQQGEKEREPREPTTVSPSSARPRRTFPDNPDAPRLRQPSSPPSPPPEPSPPPPESSRTVPVISSPPPASEETEAQEQEIDPFARWDQLASLGQSRVSSGASGDGEEGDATARDRSITAIGAESMQTPQAPIPTIPTQAQTQPTEAAEADGIPTVVIGESSAIKPPSQSQSSSNQQQFSTPGEKGILLRRRVADNTASNRPLFSSVDTNDTDTRQDSYKQIPLGTTVPARVAVPMYWDEGQGNALGQNYVIVLEEPLRSASGMIALPQGTALITEIVSVSPTRLVNQRVVAIAYQEDGEVIQHEVNPDTFSIRGANNEPLIASGYFDPGGNIAKQDILISLLSSVGKVGEIVNLPQTVSSSSASSGGETTTTSTSTTTTREDPDLLGAALQGFFQPLADSLRQRSQTQTQELLSRGNIAVVPKGTTVSVVVESFLYIQ